MIGGIQRAIATLFNKIDYLLRETLLGLKRGGWLNWAAISTLMVLLFLVGVSLQLSWGLDSTLANLGSQLEVSVFLDPDVGGDTLQPQVQELADVAEVRLIAKDEAWRELLAAMGAEDPQAAEAELGTNPLVDSLRIQASSAAALPAIAQTVRTWTGVDEVYYGSEVVERLAQLQEGLRFGTMAVSGGLTLTTVAVITTTIRLIVLARRREIEVMRLVGATATWIYLPFILQGFFFGIVGAAGAWGLVLGSQQLMGDVLAQVLAMPFLQVADPSQEAIFGILPLILLGIGTFLGTTGSLIAVRKSTAR